MPIVARLRLCVIAMYFEDHNPPHFHVIAHDGQQAIVDLATLTVSAGSVDRRPLAEALTYASANRDFLRERWNEFSR